jgi:hypothetical protein
MISWKDIRQERGNLPIWCAPPNEGDSVLWWRMKCRWWGIILWVGSLSLRGFRKRVFYRKLLIDVDFNPITGAIKSTQPLPPGASLNITYTIDSSSGDETIQLAQVTQWELRAIPSFFRKIWMSVTRKDGGLRLSASISEKKP